MSIMEHPILGRRVDYNSLNARQQEAFNFQKVSAIFAEYGYLVIKLSDDWNGPDFIALEFNTDHYLKVQLKGRFSFFKKYLNKNIHICFQDKETSIWYLYPHDDLCGIVMKKSETTASWKDQGGYSFPVISGENRSILEKYALKSSNSIFNDSLKNLSSMNKSQDNVKHSSLFVNKIKEKKDVSIISKSQAMILINKKHNLHLNDNNTMFSSINQNVEQWSFNRKNIHFSNDTHMILVNQYSKELNYFFLERGTIGSPQTTFDQRNDERVRDSSIIRIMVSSYNFKEENSGFPFGDYKIDTFKY
ncbi:MAG: hypothetical protein FWG46_01850 [Treponema sp.]|nr:hypothetical protein [Treponema sp.]